jgi:hypothetical protein
MNSGILPRNPWSGPMAVLHHRALLSVMYLNQAWLWESSLETEITAVGIHRAVHATPLYPQKLALTSPTSSGHSVGVVRSRTKATELLCLSEMKLVQLWRNPLVISRVCTRVGHDAANRFCLWELERAEYYCVLDGYCSVVTVSKTLAICMRMVEIWK